MEIISGRCGKIHNGPKWARGAFICMNRQQGSSSRNELGSHEARFIAPT